MANDSAYCPQMSERDEARFWSRVRMSDADSCWEWTGSCVTNGYGQFRVKNTFHRCHRLAYALRCGPIPKGMCVLHDCANPKCCNPSHLRLGTQLESVADRERRGRGVKPPQPSPEQRARGSRSNLSKLDEQKVYAIKTMLRYGLRRSEIASRFQVSVSGIGLIHRNKAWKHVVL